METDQIREDVLFLLKKVTNKEITDFDKNLFGTEYQLMPMDIVYICMEIKQRYGIDLNWFVDEISQYNVNEFVNTIKKGIKNETLGNH